jgi:hypothetical protein
MEKSDVGSGQECVRSFTILKSYPDLKNWCIRDFLSLHTVPVLTRRVGTSEHFLADLKGS